MPHLFPSRVAIGARSAAIVLAVCVLPLLLVACGGEADGAAERGDHGGAPNSGRPGAHGGMEAEGVLVRVAPVRVEPMVATYSTSATLRADQRATVTARAHGRIERLFVEEGETVAAGQVLAQLEDEEQVIARERATSQLETVEREFERVERLFRQELVAEEAFETKRRELDDAKQAKALADLELSRTRIEAPFAGVVLERHLDVGNTVSDGTPVYSLADTGRLRADVNVPERHVAELAAGQNVRLQADATSRAFDAEIERIAPAVDAETGTVKVTLRVAGDSGLRPGSFVRVDVVTDEKADALVVPRSALVAEGRRWSVYRVGADGDKAEQVEVRLGYENGDRVEVLPAAGAATGLAVGDRVVVAGAGGLTDGAAIEVEETVTTPPAAVAVETVEEAAEGAVAGGDAGR